jgi:hypothetical protein
MGLYDRDYMRAPQTRTPRKKPPFRQRLKFALWLLLRPLSGRKKKGE